MNTDLKNYKSIFILQVSAILALSLNSCKMHTHEIILHDCVQRMEQQNDFLYNDNQRLRNAFDALVYKEDSHDKVAYLQRYVGEANALSDLLYGTTTSLQKYGAIADSSANKLFQQYDTWQLAYQKLIIKIKDSSKNIPIEQNINSYKGLSKENFKKKYLQEKDSLNLQAQLSLLRTDILLNEHALLEIIVSYMTPIYCDFGSTRLRMISSSDRYIYKKGEKLKVQAILGNYLRTRNMHAFIDGEEVKAKDGLFNYSRKVTESPGIYAVPIKVNLMVNGKEETYLSKINFKVE